MNTCNTCCNPKTPDCGTVEMSNLQRCNGVTMHGCGNPMYNVYCWDHAHPMCHKPEPVAIEYLCEYLRKCDAAKIYATNQALFNFQTYVSDTYQTKEDAAIEDQKLDQEITDRLNGDVRLEGEIQAQSVILNGVISAETTRAKAAEQALQNNIDSEVSRAQSVEDDLSSAISGEVSRAEQKENQLQSAINSEISRAQNAEAILDTAVQANTSAIRNEVTRAQTAEQNISAAVSTLNNRVTTDVVHSADYDSTSKQIVFKNSEGTIIDSIDASAFIKDGMVSNVRIVNGVLKITFNTDAGHSDIDIPISSIFDANNYYTKSATDDKFATKTQLNNYYTKAEVDALIAQAVQNAISEVTSQLSNYYTKSQANAKFAAA